MKCIHPDCGASTEINDTRLTDGNIVRRRRLCFNGHRFTTKEIAIPGSIYDPNAHRPPPQLLEPNK